MLNDSDFDRPGAMIPVNFVSQNLTDSMGRPAMFKLSQEDIMRVARDGNPHLAMQLSERLEDGGESIQGRLNNLMGNNILQESGQLREMAVQAHRKYIETKMLPGHQMIQTESHSNHQWLDRDVIERNWGFSGDEENEEKMLKENPYKVRI